MVSVVNFKQIIITMLWGTNPGPNIESYYEVVLWGHL